MITPWEGRGWRIIAIVRSVLKSFYQMAHSMSDLKRATERFRAVLSKGPTTTRTASSVVIPGDMFPIEVNMTDSGEMAALQALGKAARVLTQKYRHSTLAIAGLAYGLAMGKPVKQIVTQQETVGANIIYSLAETARRAKGKVLQNDQKGFKVFFPTIEEGLGRSSEQMMAWSIDQMYEMAAGMNVARSLKRKDEPKGVTLTLSMSDADKGVW